MPFSALSSDTTDLYFFPKHPCRIWWINRERNIRYLLAVGSQKKTIYAFARYTTGIDNEIFIENCMLNSNSNHIQFYKLMSKLYHCGRISLFSSASKFFFLTHRTQSIVEKKRWKIVSLWKATLRKANWK